MNHYQILGIACSASIEEIRKAYKLKILEYHPDRNGNSARSNEMFRRVKEAEEVLCDPLKRKAYDRQLIYGQRSGHSDPFKNRTYEEPGYRPRRRRRASDLPKTLFYGAAVLATAIVVGKLVKRAFQER